MVPGVRRPVSGKIPPRKNKKRDLRQKEGRGDFWKKGRSFAVLRTRTEEGKAFCEAKRRGGSEGSSHEGNTDVSTGGKVLAGLRNLRKKKKPVSGDRGEEGEETLWGKKRYIEIEGKKKRSKASD